MKTSRGFIGIELGIAIAILAVLAIAAGGSYVAYHDRMTAADNATTTPTTSTTTDGWPATSTPQSGGTGTGGTSQGSVTVTSANSDEVVHLHVGDRLTLALGGDKNWSNVRVMDQGILRPLDVPMIPEDQGVFEAVAKGTTTITASGTAICNPGEACPQFVLLYKITVVVE